LFNTNAGWVSVYSLFPEATNHIYPAVTDIALFVEWSACLWGFLAMLLMVSGFLWNNKTISDAEKTRTVCAVSAVVYLMSVCAVFVGVRTQSLAVSVVGHLGIVMHNVISLSSPVPFLACSYADLLCVSSAVQQQAHSLVGPVETLSSVVLGPLGVFMFTMFASASTSSGDDKDRFVLPLQALVMNIVLLIWGTHISRTLMFLVGLLGIAVFVVHLGLTFMKGSASFVVLLVVISFSVATLGIVSQ
jgi:hypothetical protein